MKVLLAIFFSVFLAELGDKTQIATLLFATDPTVSRLGVFVASAGALTVASLLAVLLGAQISRFIAPQMLKTVAGAGFIVIGIWMLVSSR